MDTYHIGPLVSIAGIVLLNAICAHKPTKQKMDLLYEKTVSILIEYWTLFKHSYQKKSDDTSLLFRRTSQRLIVFIDAETGATNIKSAEELIVVKNDSGRNVGVLNSLFFYQTKAKDGVIETVDLTKQDTLVSDRERKVQEAISQIKKTTTLKTPVVTISPVSDFRYLFTNTPKFDRKKHFAIVERLIGDCFLMSVAIQKNKRYSIKQRFFDTVDLLRGAN